MSWVDRVGRIASFVPERVALALYRPPVAPLIRSAINGIVPRGPTEVALRGRLRGKHAILDLRREKSLWLGTYEPWVQEAIVHYVQAGEWAWDVGAFIGYHSLLMRSRNARVLAIEPDPSNLARLRDQLRLNEFDDVVVLPAAVGSQAGKGRLEGAPGDPGQTRLAETGTVECDVVTLDDVLDRFPPPSFIKMDIEGGEGDALRGASTLVERVRPTWLVESHGKQGDSAVEMLRSAGYRLRPLGKGVDVRADLPVGGPRHVLAVA